MGTNSSIATNQKANEPTSPALSPTNKNQTAAPPSLSSALLSVPGIVDTSVLGLSEGQLKRQGLECLAAVLRSLVVWGTAAGKAADEPPATPARSQVGEELPATPEGSFDKLSAPSTIAETLRQPTPDITDDPTKFESAKQKKTTLLEGVKKFNFKPKRVCKAPITRNTISHDIC